MKYVLSKIFSILKKYTFLYFIIYLVCIFIVLLVTGDTNIYSFKDVYLGVLGYGKIKKLAFLLIVMKCFNIGLLLYYSYVISYKFIVESIEFIILRAKKNYMFMLNIIFSIIILILLRIVVHLYLSLISYLMYSIFMFEYIYLLYDILIICITYTIVFIFVRVRKHI